MRILLDECVPRPLRREFPGHDVRTIREMGWAGKKNGELLALMAGAGFEVLLTVDQNLRYQQNLTGSAVAVVVMVASSNRLPDLIPLVSKVEAALSGIQPGEVVEATA
jgi:PIN like domain